MSAKNCTSTLIIGGLEFKIQTPNTNVQPQIRTILQEIIRKHKKDITKALSNTRENTKIMNINDISHVKGNAMFKDITKHLNSLGR